MRSSSLRRTLVLLAVVLTVTTFLPIGTASAADRSSGFDLFARIWDWLAVWNPAPVSSRPSTPAHPQTTTHRGPIRKDSGIPVGCIAASIDPNGFCLQGLLPRLPNAPNSLGVGPGAPTTE